MPVYAKIFEHALNIIAGFAERNLFYPVDGVDCRFTGIAIALEPFLDADWLRAGSFVTITDLGTPWKKDSFAAFSRIVIDDVQQEAALPNKLLPTNLVTGDLAGLVLGKFEGRERDDERSAFIFRGHALGDLALSALAYRKAGLTR